MMFQQNQKSFMCPTTGTFTGVAQQPSYSAEGKRVELHIEYKKGKHMLLTSFHMNQEHLSI